MHPLDPGYKTLEVEAWTLWSVAMLTVFCRLASRCLNFGSILKLQVDDYLMMFTTITFTGVVVTSLQVSIYGSNYVSDEEAAAFTPEDVRHAIWGSKMLMALEEFSLATLWLVKTCLLILYYRMTSRLREGQIVKLLAVYCALGYIIIQILYLGVWCRPIHNYWAVPVPDDQQQCKTYRHHMIMVSAFHISSDLAMLGIPLPLVLRSTLPLRRKLILTAVFGLGVLVVVVGILNRYYNFTVNNSLVFLNWYNGEASTAMMIANIPLCWTLLRRLFGLHSWGNSTQRARSAAAAAVAAAAAHGGFGPDHDTGHASAGPGNDHDHTDLLHSSFNDTHRSAFSGRASKYVAPPTIGSGGHRRGLPRRSSDDEAIMGRALSDSRGSAASSKKEYPYEHELSPC